jgi:aldose 1-epimerase
VPAAANGSKWAEPALGRPSLMNMRFLLLILPGLFLFAESSFGASLAVESASFGRTKGGQEVSIFTLQNENGVRAKVITYGAIIYSLELPDRNGILVNVTANRETLADYEARSACFGAVVGRFANRIANASFSLDEKKFSITPNAGKHHIHGGAKGFDKVVWTARVIRNPDSVAVQMEYTSMDGEEGYPGTVKCGILYELNNKNEWKMQYSATSDKATPVNLSNHAYWNLAGAYSGNVLRQELTVNAEQYLLADEALIPTGEFASVEGTPVDFRQPHKIGERIGKITDKQFGGGYDHCMVIKKSKPGELAFAAKLEEPASGRTMEVWTTEPGVQIFSANFGPGAFEGPNGYAYPRHLGLCLETQHFPDSPNKANFPSTILRPGQAFSSTTIHKFGLDQ